MTEEPNILDLMQDALDLLPKGVDYHVKIPARLRPHARFDADGRFQGFTSKVQVLWIDGRPVVEVDD